MKRFRLRGKFLAVMIGIFVVIMVVNYGWKTYSYREQMIDNLKLEAERMTELLDSMWDFIYINQDAINYTDDGEYEFKKLHCAIVGESVGILFTQKTGVITHYTNLKVRNASNEPDEFEVQALLALKEDTEKNEYYEVTEYEGEPVFRYLSELTVDETCLECHGSPKGAKDELGFAKEGWSVGDMGGAVSYIIPIQEYLNTYQDFLRHDAVLFFCVMIIGGLLMIWIVSNLVIAPLGKLNRAVGQVKNRNFRAHVPERELKDEFHSLAINFNYMVDELSELYQNLEEKVETRTAQLSRLNGILEEQKKKLEAANVQLQKDNELKSDFLAIMSHELKTPLTSILALTGVLQQSGEKDEKEERILREVTNNGRVLLNMINNILDMARLEAGTVHMSRELVDLSDLLIFVEEIIRPLAQQKQICFDTQIDPNVPLLYCDGDKITRILENLCGNAIKFTPEGGKIQVRIFYEEERHCVCFRVEDTGIGIEAEDQKRIFEKFVQTDQSASRRYNGSGLGLAIVQDMVKLHDGWIELESEPGKGSVFTVRIPEQKKEGDEENEDHVGR